VDPDLQTAAASIRVVDPRETFRLKMEEIRQQYAKEAAAARILDQERAAKAVQGDQEKQNQLELEIAAYKAERARAFWEEAGGEKGEGRPTLVDDVVLPPPEGVEPDPFVERRQFWKKMVEERKKARFANFANNEKQVSERRLEALLYLFHAATDFVTYRNLDEKLNYQMEPTHSGIYNNTSVAKLLEAHALGKNDTGVQREIALTDVMMGTLHDGQLGVEGVRELNEKWTREGGAEGEEEAKRKAEEYMRESRKGLDNRSTGPRA
ncbi:hypothetical protein HK104_004266, partial [Borealophlyctis nickersoniae]